MNGRREIAGWRVRRDAVVKAECGAPTAITVPRARACPLRPLFAAALLARSAALALPAAAQTTTEPVWSATMTAGDTRIGHGYDATDPPAVGALDGDDLFDYGSLSYRVVAIDVAPNVVRFAIEPGGQLSGETLTLEFGGHALAFSDQLPVSLGQSLYWSVPAALDDLETEFPVGSTATVCLRTDMQVCPAGRIVTPAANAAPSFSSSATFDAAENQTTAGTVLATDSDADDDVTGYEITGGADQTFFSIGTTSGALTFDAAPNYEDAKDQGSNNTYVVEVTATSGTGTREKTATQTITVTVTDVNTEAPGKPGAPTVSAASVSSLSVNWSAPTNAGPAITDYDMQYRAGNSGDWSDAGHAGTATTATLTGLSENTSYDVQVRATNAEGTGSWSDSGSGTTDANAAPSFSSSATFDAAENQTTAGTVLATDSDTGDDVTGYEITGGADQTFFSIGTTSGALTFDTAPNYEDAKDQGSNNTYVVEVTATSGAGEREKTATQTITVTVTDVNTEAPGQPAAPTVSAASVSSLSVNWSAPDNAGPAITDYDYRHRTTSPEGTWTEVTGTTITTLSATLTGLAENTSYDVQVRATNAEGTGSWSDSGSGTTDANAAPSFSSSATFDAAENQTTAGTVLATDSDTGDDVTGYEITGGADQTFFSIGATDGALTFDAAPNYEDAKDQGSNNTYVVEVTATSGTGTREKTATQTITVTVTDVNTEAPGKPGAPTVTAASVSSLSVNWSAPSNAGPAITDYDYRHRTTSPEGTWTEVTGTTITTLSATIGSLAENTSYDVQVRATNAEGTGSWSDSGSGTTDANAAPSFSSSATFDAAENQTTAGTVLATDSDTGDDVTGYEITGGADQTFLSIGATDGALTFDAAPNYEDAKDQGSNNTYVVEVTATSGTGTREKTATQTITVTVTDVNTEAPGKPGAPTVTAASVTSLTVNWSAPSNAGPAITDYDYRHRTTSPEGTWTEVTGTTITTLSATIGSLAENTSYDVQVRATNAEGTGSWSDSGSGTTDANAAPSFSSSATFDAAENQTTAGTVLATDSDADDDVTGYEITGGADQTFFSIGTTSGALTFDAAPNYEDAKDQGSNNTYVVEVTATSGTGTREKTATQTITVTVTDVNTEAPGKPGAPTVSAASVSSLSVNWSAPTNAGPAITDYDMQYRAGNSGDWSDAGHAGTATTATLTGLSENTSYDVQVRATNAEGTGSWSDSGSGTTDANAAPSFSSSATFDAAENQTTAGTVLATDSDTGDDVTGYEITGGADQTFFSIGTTSGALTFDTAPNYEDAKDQGSNNTYVVEVTATSGAGEREKTATQTITVTVTDVNTEAPGQPAAPTVSAASVSSLSVNWSAPDNAGPAITDYDYRHRTTSPEGTWTEVTGTTITTLSATLTGLAENTSYDVQVRATNAEGTGSWSDSGSGTTDANAAPSFSSSATFDAAENQTTAGTVLATDSDTGDDVTGYEITGGADQTFFSIGATDGALTFDAAPNYEDAKDQGSNNTYVVEVTATSGTGTREKTATQTITVTVTDVNTEAPGKPGAPTVTAASVSSLSVNWSAPSNAGPAITDYDYRHRTTSPEGTWTEVTGTTITTLSATIGSLAENTSYDVQVRATNAEGTGSWSDSGSGTTDANAAPSFSSSATFDAAENQTTAGTVLATDSDTGDDVTGYEITGGADQTFLSIGATDGALTFDAAPNYEDAKDQGSNNTYVVEVTATSGTGTREKTATQTITVTVTDVNTEAPGKPGAPTVTAASVTSLTVNWSAPSNAGPAITDYDYRHRTTSPEGTWTEVTGTTITTLSATIGSLAENTSYDVQVRATNAEGTGSWSDSGSGTTDANAAPSFSSSATFDAAENQTTAGTVLATDSDTGDDVTGYEITGGADQTFLSIGATDGALTFDAAPNYEDAKDQGSNNTYVVEVTATSGTGTREKTATQTITVTVTDVNTEAPGKPGAPTVTAASVTSLTVNWSAPSNAGPAITDYDVQYRAGNSGDWSDAGHAGTATTAALTGLSENTSYQVQVRAKNAEGTGSWSDSGSGTTDANAAPSFSSSATFDAAENQTTAGTVLATDSDTGDDVTGYEITGGADQTFFSIGATDGALTFDAAPNYEDAKDQGSNNTYVVEVTATSGTGEREKTATQTITVTVTDVNTEAPGKPGAPAVTAASVTSLSVNWLAPTNAGPAITDYDVQYRAGNSGDWSDAGHAGTATTATLTGLSENTSYQVQVRAKNAEGTGSWSDSGSGSTDANAAPSFSSSATFDAAENQTTAGTVLATDSDTGDDVTGYEITGGADQTFFSIGATDGTLTFDAAPNYEDAKDQGSNNTYVVEVTATSGTGTREKTATQTITATVTDVNTEAPGKPGAPTVTAASVTSLTVNWSAPSNAGPAITDYDVQYRAGNSGDWSDAGHAGTATTAALTGLSENTSYQVQVRATNDEGTGSWSDSGSGSTDANAAPSFSSSATFDAAENQTTAGTVLATDSDTDDDVTGYEITGGADQTFFSIGATDGALTFDAAPNYEDAKDQGSNNTYVVEVTATSGTGEREKTATQTITVTVTDVNTEAPGQPGAPAVSAASVTSLSVNWSAPTNAGPAITDYDVQYRAGNSGDWSDGGHAGTATTATLTGLSENTSYQVQVRATNAEGTGSWSDSGSGSTDANAAPSFSSSATFDAAENQTTAGTVLATDSDTGDDVTGYEITGGADQTFFSIGATDGTLTFDAAPNYEDAKDQGTNNTYVVEVAATSGTGTREKTATQTITVTVTDVNTEAPGKPAAPAVSAASAASLTVNWSAPSNAGPAITDYDVQYRAGNSGDWSDGGHAGTAVTATLTGLSENTSYDVQVRATNAEGTGSWSDSGSGSTDANAAPSFSSSATFDAAENQTTAGTVLATDSDTGDDITGYAITGGADEALFEIGATDGALTFDAAPNYEDAKDQGSNNTYVVEVTATSGTGEREKTATQTITVTVTDVNTEAPGQPGAPAVSASSVTSLSVNWSAPSNAGPAITDYDVQYRAGNSGDWSDAGHTGTAVTATLTGLSENTSHQVQVRATNDEGTGSWSDSGSGTTDANAAPSFSSSATFDAAENQTTAGTVLATDSDTGDDITGYEITGGADQTFFSIGATDGALTFDAAPNYEDAKDQGTNNTYVVEVTATSGTGEREKTATQTITVTVTDVNTEAPGQPAAPAVSAASVTSLSVNWSAPSNAGPAITDYDVQYRAGNSGDWSDGGHAGTATTAALTGLSENTSYQVQVRATNAEGTGSWSDSGSGSTDANAAPSFSSSATFDAAENQTTAGTVLATDSDTGDDVTGYEITGGADQTFFSIGATDGALTFDAAPNYEDAKDQGTNNTYVVEVAATSGTGTREKTATQTITVTVTDVNTEAPGKPAAPAVSAASAASLSVNWSAPSNAGPAITDYDVQYRAGNSGDWSDGGHAGTATTATLTGLSENTSYDVQVRATNAEGTGSWSDSGTGTTDANAAPSFSSSATFDAAENQTTAGTVLATDSDTGDDVTGYEITGGGGPDVLVDRGDGRGADVRRGAELRGRQGPGQQQHLRGGGDGDERHGDAGEDGDADDHGDGDRREHGGAGQAGRADGDGRVGDQPDGELVGAVQRGPGDHGLRRAVPGGQQRGLERRGPRRHGHHGGAHGPVGEHLLPGAGAGHQRRGHRLVVGLGQRLDGRERGAVVQLLGDVRRGGEPDDGGHGAGDGQRHGRRRDGLRDHRRGGPDVLLDRGDGRGADVRRGAQLRGRQGPGQQQHLRGGGDGDERHGGAGEDGDADDHGDGDRREHGGAGPAGRAGGVGGVGDQPERELVGAHQRGSGDHGLRRAVPGGQQRGLERRGPRRHGHHGDAHGPVGEHLLPGAGAGHQRRRDGLVVGLGQRLDGRGRARCPHRPDRHRRRGDRDRPVLDHPRQQRRLRHHRLQDRGLLGWRLQLDQPRRQHRQHQHRLHAHRAHRRHHPPLPGLGHQLHRHRPHLRRRQRHHRRRRRWPDGNPGGRARVARGHRRRRRGLPGVDGAGGRRRLARHRLRVPLRGGRRGARRHAVAVRGAEPRVDVRRTDQRPAVRVRGTGAEQRGARGGGEGGGDAARHAENAECAGVAHGHRGRRIGLPRVDGASGRRRLARYGLRVPLRGGRRGGGGDPLAGCRAEPRADGHGSDQRPAVRVRGAGAERCGPRGGGEDGCHAARPAECAGAAHGHRGRRRGRPGVDGAGGRRRLARYGLRVPPWGGRRGAGRDPLAGRGHGARSDRHGAGERDHLRVRGAGTQPRGPRGGGRDDGHAGSARGGAVQHGCGRYGRGAAGDRLAAERRPGARRSWLHRRDGQRGPGSDRGGGGEERRARPPPAGVRRGRRGGDGHGASALRRRAW